MKKRKPHTALFLRIRSDLAKRLKSYAAATNTTETAIAQAAFAQYLYGTSDLTAVMRRLDALSRHHERISRDLRMLSEAFGAFVHVWYHYTPELPDEAKRSAQRQAARRYDAFLQHVSNRLGNGRALLDDLVREDLFAMPDEVPSAPDSAPPADEVPPPSEPTEASS